MKNKLIAIVAGILLLAPLASAYVGKMNEPVAKKVVTPEVPYEFRGIGEDAEVIVHFRIDSEGRVRDLEVNQATNEAYARSVVNAVRWWRFEPVQVDGMVVEPKVALPVRFVSEDK
jgi:TonB family protein